MVHYRRVEPTPSYKISQENKEIYNDSYRVTTGVGFLEMLMEMVIGGQVRQRDDALLPPPCLAATELLLTMRVAHTSGRTIPATKRCCTELIRP